MDLIYERCHHLLTRYNQDLLSPPTLRQYADAIQQAGAGWHLKSSVKEIRNGETYKKAVKDSAKASTLVDDQADKRVGCNSHKNNKG